jgi:hypothetical protein
MKPDWKDAPEWARYLAMDQGRRWHWHESRPKRFFSSWLRNGNDKYQMANGTRDKSEISVRYSLEERP